MTTDDPQPRAHRSIPRVIALLAALAAAAALTACGAEAPATAGAVEAREQNEARVDGLVYRVPLFRQLNPRIAPDRAFYDGPPPPEGEGVYAAFVRVCNPTGEPQSPTRRIHLEDAFGQRFAPVSQPDNPLAYTVRPLPQDECLPSRSDASTAEGAVLAFRVPFDSIAERPLILVIEGRDGGARIELDV